MTMKNTIAMLLGTCLLLWGCDDTSKKTEGCGNGLLDLGEECDGDAGDATTCADLGYYEQFDPVRCGANCRWDLSVCAGRCGDGLIQVQHGEDCEGDDLGGDSCITLGYERGTLACGAGCRHDLSACEVGGDCGNGVVEAPEQCEDTDLNGETCETLGYHGGALVCANDCSFDLASCESYGRCGDGVIQEEYAEACEGTDFQGETCETLNYNGGTLACLADCTLDLSECEAAGQCGDEIVQQPFEECEISDLDGQTCMTLGFVSGTLTCNRSCGFDTSGCSMNYVSPNIGTLIYVPAGTFQWDFTPANLSVVSAFRMSKYEITRAQWVTVTGWADPSDGTYSSGVNDPVQRVSWYDALAFCNKLSLLEGLTPVYAVSGVDFTTLTYAQIPAANDATWNEATANWAANGYRLPTEMEWMWAAMGADTENPGAVNTTGYAKAFAGSTGTNAIGDYAVFGYGTIEVGSTMTPRSNPVGSKLANELGFHDLTGNVWEWVWDWRTAYPAGTLTDYRGPTSGTYRVGRGGHWYYDASDCAVAYRDSSNPYSRYYLSGFRVVRN